MLAKNRPHPRDRSLPSWSIPLALLGLTLLSYGLRALSLGFFWDDWPYLWFFHRFGPAGIVTAFSGDRPFLSFIYTISLTVLGSSSQGWQIFGLLARWMCGVGLWWALAETWPRRANKAAWAAMLFTVYSGFTQQWIAVIYGQAFLLFAAVFFSTGLTVWIARRRSALKRGWIAAGTLMALALSAFTMFSTEYFFGLELLRPVLLWIVFLDDAGLPPERGRAALLRRARQTAAWWAPYLALMLVFVLWRILVHPFTGYGLVTLQNVETSPLRGVWNLALGILQDLVVATLAAWGQPLQILPGFLDQGHVRGLRLLGLIVVTGALVTLYLTRLRAALRPANLGERTIPEDRWAVQAILVGLLAMLAAGWPTWLTNLPMRMGFPLDRYTLAISVGVSILLAGLIDLIGKDRLHKAAVLGLIIGLAVGFHFQTSQRYAQDWESARNFFWQLTWRAPAVRPNTLFASVNMPFQYFEDDSLTAPLNWTYDPDGRSKQMAYLLYDLDVRNKSLTDVKPGVPVQKTFRSAEFSGSTSQMLLFYYPPKGCLRILDPARDSQLFRLPNRLLQAMPLSSPQALIQDEAPAAAPPAEIFNPEPVHRWCYFYEKAELARQLGDWDTIYQLSRESIHEGIRPQDPVEYLPFIEAFARRGQLDDALQLSQDAETAAPEMRPVLCSVWQQALKDQPPANTVYWTTVRERFQCSAP